MIQSRKDLKYYLSEDRRVMGGGNLFRLTITWLLGAEHSRMMLYLWVLRHLEFYTNVKVPIIGHIMKLFFYIWHRRQCLKYGVYIKPNLCGFGLRIVHIGGIHLNALKVGNYCTVTQGVILGSKGDNSNRPIVGDNVELTIGSKIIGKVVVGNNSVVCPNSVVIKDVPDNCIVSGVPINIVKQRKSFK